MKTLVGGLSIVCFLAVAVATLAYPEVGHSVSEAKTVESHPDLSGFTRPYRSEVKVRGVRVEFVVMEGCGPCKRLKQTTIPALEKAGYKVQVTNYKDDPRKPEEVPVIYYYGKLGTTVRTDVGYRTYAQVTKYLEKP